MAINFGKGKETLFASTDLMSFGKAFSRMAAQPLDMYEVWYDYDALVAYAANTDSATATAYVGQKVAYIDANDKVTHYSIEADGSLKELGTTPVGDESSIVVDENGTISLKGVSSLVFEREVEGKEEKEEVKFQPLMTKDGLVWIEPSKTTVEGLAVLIEELTGRVGALETKVGKAAEGENAATGLFKAVADEIARADAAEKALGERIDAIDFVDGDELETALAPYAKTADLEPYAKTADVVSKADYAVDKKALDDKDIELAAAAKEAKDAADAAQKAIDDFLVGTGAEDVIDTLTDIKEALDSLTDPAELAQAIAGKADKTELANYVTNEIYNAHITAQEAIDEAQDKALNDYKAEIVETLKGYQTVIPAETYDAYGAAATAKSEAIADADSKLANKADSSYVGIIPSNYTETNVVAYINKKAEEVLSQATGGSSESAASVKAALDTYKSENEPKFAKLEEIEAKAQVNVLEGVQVDGTDLAITDKKVNINLTPYAKQADLNTVSAQADKGVADAATAQSKANSAYALAEENKGALETLAGTVSTNKAAADAVAGRVSTLETAKADHETRIGSLETTIIDKADKSALSSLETSHNNRLSTLESDNSTNKASISTLQGTVNGHTARFAGMTETDTVVSLVNEAKGLANTAQGTANEAKGLVSSLETGKVKANADAIAALDERLTVIDKANDGKIAVIESNISGLNTRLTALDKEGGRVALIEGRVSTVESDVTALKGQITGLTGAMHWRGEVESLEGLTGYVSGDVVSVKGSAQEYIFDGENWKLFGDEGSYALKDNVYTKSEVYTKTETDGLLTALTTAHEGLISAAEGRAAEDATSKANAAEANAKAYVDAAMSWLDME